MSIFNQISGRRPKKNSFDLSHERKFSFNMGELIPILSEEVVPGDTFRNNTEIMLRLAPMLAPVMHRVNVYTHFFFVPNRIIWNNWEDFITGGKSGTSLPTHPYINIDENISEDRLQAGSLADYLGVPSIATPFGTDQHINALPFRAYQEIYNEYYRDQNLSDPIDFGKGDGNGGYAEDERLLLKRHRCWEKDYFTSALPWTQRGQEARIPIGGEWSPQYEDTSTIVTSAGAAKAGAVSSDATARLQVTGTNMRIENLVDPQTLDTGGVTINDLRRASRLQEWVEKNARGGSRYIEQILSHFGIISSDARLQRPEYLGGGKAPVNISEVLQTSSTDATSPQGEMAGHGIAVGNSNTFSKTFEEHGIVIGIVSVLPRTSYQQGLKRLLFKNDKFDYYWPEFANLGEQEVYQKEIWSDLKPDDSIFGYQSRYAEYKHIQSSVHGDFKTNLSFWHMGRIFGAKPVLSNQFVTADPTHRIFPVPDPLESKLYCQVYNNLKAIRPMPFFGTPTL